MRITVEFESLEEFQAHMAFGHVVEITQNGITLTHEGVPVSAGAPESAHVEEVPTTAEEAPTTPAEAAPVAIPWEKPEDAVEAKAPKITEDFRVEVRKTLAALNKVQTGNPAKALIAEIGYKRLTDVPLELLPGLMEKAKEAMNNA